MALPDRGPVGCSTIPNFAFLDELRDNELRAAFTADHVKTRIALLIKTLRDQRQWSQAELGKRMGKPQNVVSRLEDPDYGKMSLQTLLEVASAFELPLYIDMPNWGEWFELTDDMSAKNLERESFDADRLKTQRNQQALSRPDTKYPAVPMPTNMYSSLTIGSLGNSTNFHHWHHDEVALQGVIATDRGTITTTQIGAYLPPSLAASGNQDVMPPANTQPSATLIANMQQELIPA